MKSFIAASVALLATCATALPNPLVARQDPTHVTFALSNDQTGGYASAKVAIDGVKVAFSALFGSSVLGSTGEVIASSAQLTAFPQDVQCVLSNWEVSSIATLTPENTYFDLDGNPKVAAPFDVSNYGIECSY